jgi:hypothetical protein
MIRIRTVGSVYFFNLVVMYFELQLNYAHTHTGLSYLYRKYV